MSHGCTLRQHASYTSFCKSTLHILGALGRLPNWLMLAHFFICSLGAVRRKERTHFFWFLVVTSMLLEILLQVVGVVDRWLRSGLYWGKIGMHFWTVIAFGHLFTVLECTRCAVSECMLTSHLYLLLLVFRFPSSIRTSRLTFLDGPNVTCFLEKFSEELLCFVNFENSSSYTAFPFNSIPISFPPSISRTAC